MTFVSLRFVSRPTLKLAVAALTMLSGLPVAADNGPALDKQRQLFVDVIETVERGDWSAVENLPAEDRTLLQQYVLWPDLRATYLRNNLRQSPRSDIEAFLQRHGMLRPARELRYRHALHLAKRGDLQGYRRIYEQFYQGRQDAKLDCLALQADIEAGRDARVAVRGVELWLIGKSQVSECDPVFEHLRQNKRLGAHLYRQRYQLAIDAREFQLARWLARSIDQQHVDDAGNWLRAQSNPENFLDSHTRRNDRGVTREQLVYAVERLTYRDPERALRAWKRVEKRAKFSSDQRSKALRHIALWTARDNLPGAYELLVKLRGATDDSEVSRWRARTSLRASEWEPLLRDIAAMPDDERDAEEWRYWRAVALKRLGQVLTAHAAFNELREERSYYGFLAADEISESYTLSHSELAADETVIATIASRPDVIRARELFVVGQDGRGRSEWDTAVRLLSPEHQQQAAILAHRWGWHSRAISTAASLGEYDDLLIRYPLPYQESFEQSSSAASISPTWAYGIARSESLFMRDVRSPAGAIGLMQLMPATGRAVARNMRLPYSGLQTLIDPASNIRLGTTYLGQMAERYSGNSVLATAAYNAGPHRVDRWLPDSGTIDARVWIENIPFNETRRYVKRVLAAQAIFDWRISGQVRRLSDSLSVVRAAGDPQKIAAR